MINEYCDKVVCINLQNRPDKKEFMKTRFDHLAIDVEWFHPVQYGFADKIVNALYQSKSRSGHFNTSQPNEFGAAMSHYTVIKTALQQGVEKLCVFEDDAIFHKDYTTLLAKYMTAVPEDADILLFYSFMYNLEPKNVRVNARWMKAYKSWSLLNYIMNKKAMEEYIERQDRFFTIADSVTYNMQEVNQIKTYCTTPCLVLPSTNLASNIRTVKNYETTQTVLQLGVSPEKYE